MQAVLLLLNGPVWFRSNSEIGQLCLRHCHLRRCVMSMRILRSGRFSPAQYLCSLRHNTASVRAYRPGVKDRESNSFTPRERPDRPQRYQSEDNRRNQWQRGERGRHQQDPWQNQYADRKFDRGAPARDPRSTRSRDNHFSNDRPVTSTSQLQDNWVGDAVYGVNPVLAALKSGRRSIYSLHVQEGLKPAKRKDQTAVSQAKQAAKDAGATVQTASKHDLNMISGNRPHQGLVLDCSPLSFVQIDTIEDANESSAPSISLTKPPLWLVLDEVMDPQNFGAALRSAHFLGASGVLTCSRNSAPLSPVVSKASAGAMEAMPVHSAQNLPRTLAAAANSGWQVIGAASESESQNCLDVRLTRPTLLVLGNEGVGLRTTVRNVCRSLIKIDLGHSNSIDDVDSLNVSVATGILLHQLLSSTHDNRMETVLK